MNIKKSGIQYHPKTREELKSIIREMFEKGETNLNCIDVSSIDDMSGLFNALRKDEPLFDDSRILGSIDVSGLTGMLDYIAAGYTISEWSKMINKKVPLRCITPEEFARYTRLSSPRQPRRLVGK